MKLIQWPDAGELGHQVIDAEHRRIVEILNEAIRAFNDHQDAACSKAVKEAVDIIRCHFRHEETILSETGYGAGDLREHTAYHNRLLAEAGTIAGLCDHDRGRDFLEARLAEFVHFIIYEIKYGDAPLRGHLAGGTVGSSTSPPPDEDS